MADDELLEPPRVAGLFTAAAAGELMSSHVSVEVAAGLGILGDRYATRKGHWSDPQWKDQQLTLVSAELAAELGLPPDGLRRNIVTRGIDLDILVGLEFGIGTARFIGRRICAPCGYIGRVNNRPGLFRELAGRGGIRVSVEVGGVVSVGDEIRILGAADEVFDE
ncbi:MAG: MOSC domain-containing protein [Dehalococcoidia bacterium]